MQIAATYTTLYSMLALNEHLLYVSSLILHVVFSRDVTQMLRTDILQLFHKYLPVHKGLFL